MHAILKKIKTGWYLLFHIGIEDELNQSEKARVKITNRLVVINTALIAVYMIVNMLSDPGNGTVNPWWTQFINIGGILIMLPVLISNYMGWYQVARLLLCGFLFSALLINNYHWAAPYRTEMYFFAFAALVFVLFQRNKKVAVLLFVIQAIAFGFVVLNTAVHHPEWNIVPATLFVRVFIAFALLFFIIYFVSFEADSYSREVELKNIQISQERDEMEKLNYTKDKIFSIISHDLRAPIASLQSLLALVNDEAIDQEDFKRATLGLEKQVFQMRTSLDELLTWSKAQLHGINPIPESLNLRQSIIQVVAVLKAVARDKRIIITTQLDGDLTVFCDPNMLHSVFTNLISNAIKFTPVGGAISILAELRNKTVHIVVEDTGVGIPSENIEKILNPSTLFTTRGTNNEKGTGLGLAMCAEFIQKNNGTFEIESEDGKGSRFLISLPILAPEVSTTAETK